MSPSTQPDESLETLTGVLDRIIFHNPDNHYCVAEMDLGKRRGHATVVGNLPHVQCGETLELKGLWKQHKIHGSQFEVKDFKSKLPASVYGIRKYLGSGLVPGIGPSYANKIVDKFGDATLRIIEEDSGRLREVEGIGPKRAREIKNAWDEQRAYREVMVFLQTYGIGPRQCIKLVKNYGAQTREVLQNDPYCLIRDIEGIGFKTADQIAKNIGFPNKSPQRIDAGLQYILRDREKEGHTAIDANRLAREGVELLEVPSDDVEPRIQALIDSSILFPLDETGLVQLRNTARAEQQIASGIARLQNTLSALPPIKIEVALQWASERSKLKFASEQADAIRTALGEKVSILTGGPGTGKTTILRSLVDILRAKKVKMVLASPTGRAAQRLSSAASHFASTIHRLLQFDPGEGKFLMDESRPLSADFVIIDESSMLDTRLAAALIRAIPSRAHVLLVGDANQLPSVGPGNVLGDLIASQLVPTVSLQQIFRQRETSNIVSTAHNILGGNPAPPCLRKSRDELDPKWDFQFLKASDSEDAANQIMHLLQHYIPRYLVKPGGSMDVQVLAPMHRGTCGIIKLNQQLQQLLNPHNPGIEFGQNSYKVQDRVIQTRNNYELNIFNGDLGVVSRVNPEAGTLAVQFGKEEVDIDRGDLADLELAYAISIHKSQGSEFPCIVMPLLKEHFILLQRNLLYTAITRGKRKVFIVGDPTAYAMAVNNSEQRERQTGLPHLLRK